MTDRTWLLVLTALGSFIGTLVAKTAWYYLVLDWIP